MGFYLSRGFNPLEDTWYSCDGIGVLTVILAGFYGDEPLYCDYIGKGGGAHHLFE